MRLAIYYDIVTGRNDGNPLYVWAALKRRQEQGLLEIDHLAPAENINLFGTYDANILVDWGEDGLDEMGLIPYKMVDIPKPNIYWASDTHLGFSHRLETARKFDHVFVAQKKAAREFATVGVKAEWLPHAFEPFAYHDISTGVPTPFEFASKDHDIAFVGHVNSDNRVDFLDRMFKEFPNFFFGQRRFQDAAQIYAKSKICINIAMVDDVNMRCFEIAGAGGCLLTTWLPDMEELGFVDGQNCILFNSLDEAVEKTSYYLAHDEERERIAKAGFDLVMSRHTIDHRVDVMLSRINELVQVPA